MATTREEIKARLIKSALQNWENDHNRSEQHMDPLIHLLFSSFAAELSTLSHHLDDTRQNISTYLSSLLFPETGGKLRPAHALATCTPLDIQSTLSADEVFDSDSRDFSEKITFTPAYNTQLLAASVKYILVHQQLYKIDRFGKRTFVNEQAHLPTNQYYIGVGFQKGALLTEDLILHVTSDLQAPTINSRLKSGNWSIQGHPVNIESRSLPEKDFFAPDYSYIRSITDTYEPQFIRIKTKRGTSLESLIDQPDEAFIDPLVEEKDICWIRLDLDGAPPFKSAETFRLKTNVFPIVGRKTEKRVFVLNNLMNILPLTINEGQFLSMNKVSDAKGNDYKINAQAIDTSDDLPSCYVKERGITKLNHIVVKDYIEHLIELIKDESAAFSLLGKDLVSNDLITLHQTIARLEKRLQIKEDLNDQPYLFINKRGASDQLFVNYFSCNINKELSIKAGSKLKSQRNGLLDDELTLQNNVRPPRQLLQNNDLLRAARYKALTSDQLVTQQDIRHFCLHELGDLAQDISLERVVTVDETGGGYRKGTQINIHTHDLSASANEQLQIEAEDLLHKIEQRTFGTEIFTIQIKHLN